MALLFFFTAAFVSTDILDSLFSKMKDDSWLNVFAGTPFILFFLVFGAMTKSIWQVIWQSVIVATITMLFFTVKTYFDPKFEEYVLFPMESFPIVRFAYSFTFITLVYAGLFLVFAVAAWLVKIVFSSFISNLSKQSGTTNNTF